MKNLLYISPLPQDSQTGGANAVNYHIYKQLEKHFNCTYVQINPKESKLGKWRSQFLRKILRRPGRFNFYSKNHISDHWLKSQSSNQRWIWNHQHITDNFIELLRLNMAILGLP